MSAGRAIALLVLAMIAGAALFADQLRRVPYAEQYRDNIEEPPSRSFPLGTDALGRDRLARLLHGTRTSILLAPGAAAIAVGLAVIAGVIAGIAGRRSKVVFEGGTDLFLSLPWLFVLIAVRASLPLDTPPVKTALVTFASLALLGWAAPARVVRNAVASLSRQDFVLQAQALGAGGARLWFLHALPNLRTLALAQFLVSLPVFIVAEANLGLLGLGLSEPVPSLGGLLRELESAHAILERPWLLAPAGVLVAVVGSIHVLTAQRSVQS